MQTFREYILEGSKFEKFKKNEKPLTTEEREECLKSKAIWHHGKNGEATPAVWKSVDEEGESTYITNTHRAFAAKKSLKAAISKYHSFIKGTA